MIPVLNITQIREADAYTIKHEPIASIDLMERASQAFVHKWLQIFRPNPHQPIICFCGVGNNGGDGLVVSRILANEGFKIRVFIVGDLTKCSADFRINHNRLPNEVGIDHLENKHQFPFVEEESLIIDALFGTGLSRPVTGWTEEVIQLINQTQRPVCSLDIPSGMFAEQPQEGATCIFAKHTITFEVPKLGFFFPENYPFVGDWHLVTIGLNRDFIQSQATSYFLAEKADVSVPKRTRFDHKGKAGRLLLVAGSNGKAGAAILATQAALRSGAGLVFVHSNEKSRLALQVAAPEAMVIPDPESDYISLITLDSSVDAVAIGPGIGMHSATAKAFEYILRTIEVPLIIDADGINLLAEHRYLIDLIPVGTILTPHPGEFARLCGSWRNDYEKLKLLQGFCKQHQVHMVLKGAYSAVCNPDGQIIFNPTGNPGMATGGSGDVLSGMIGAFLAQGLQSGIALRSAVYIHGLSGDLACENIPEVAMIASDLIAFLPKTLKNWD